MRKLLTEYRRPLADFELVDVVSESDAGSIRARLDVSVPLSVRWNDWDYGSAVAELRSLYDKGKKYQWNAAEELDWSTKVSRDEWIAHPQASILAMTCASLGKDEAIVKSAMFDEINYILSQILHGEQAALQLCGQLVNLGETTDEKLYAAQQTADEARHTEVFARFLADKMGTIYPVSPAIKVLLDELLSAEGFAKKTLGMQTLFEGVAMGIFGSLRQAVTNPLMLEMIRRVEVDESRHAAFGVLTMRRVVQQADESERRELEDWAFAVLEALNAAQRLDLLKTLGPKYGIDPERLTKHMLGLPEYALWNSQLYMHTVMPNLTRLGLVTERTEPAYRKLAILSDARVAA